VSPCQMIMSTCNKLQCPMKKQIEIVTLTPAGTLLTPHEELCTLLAPLKMIDGKGGALSWKVEIIDGVTMRITSVPLVFLGDESIEKH
jgi:hypothetical protein